MSLNEALEILANFYGVEVDGGEDEEPMTKKLIWLLTMVLSLVGSCVFYGYLTGLSANEIFLRSYFMAAGSVLGWIIRNLQGTIEEERSNDTAARLARQQPDT